MKGANAVAEVLKREGTEFLVEEDEREASSIGQLWDSRGNEAWR